MFTYENRSSATSEEQYDSYCWIFNEHQAMKPIKNRSFSGIGGVGKPITVIVIQVPFKDFNIFIIFLFVSLKKDCLCFFHRRYDRQWSGFVDKGQHVSLA